jgi:Tol biopolymer transport system component
MRSRVQGRLIALCAVAVVCAINPTAVAAHTATVRVSASSGGAEGNDHSWFHQISADGRFVAFRSSASNLVPGDGNGKSDIFVRDLQAGSTERVSVSTTGGDGNGTTNFLSISADGRFVAFDSFATNLVSGDTNGKTDIFVRDRETGITTLASLTSSGGQAASSSGDPSISADGARVAFESGAANLVPGDANGAMDVFVRDRLTNATILASATPAGGTGNGRSHDGAISSDGRFVAFRSDASDLVPDDTNGVSDIFVRDLQAGITERVSVSPEEAEANRHSYSPSISGDGRFVAFHSTASNFFAFDSRFTPNVFVRDRVTADTILVSRAWYELFPAQGEEAAITPDGRFVAFWSRSANLVPGDTNSEPDVFVRDLLASTTTRVSLSDAGTEVAGGGGTPSISADGRFVVFTSYDTTLVAGDANARTDVFVRDRGAACPAGGFSDGTISRPIHDALETADASFAHAAACILGGR